MFAYLLFGRERAQSYTVHEPSTPSSDRVDRAEALEFVKDGFVFGAFVLPIVWLALHRIWLGVVAYVVAVAVLLFAASQLGLPPVVPAMTLLALHLVIGNEAGEILRGHLAAQGWTMVGQVTGTGPLDCERRFFDSWLPSLPMMTPNAVPVSAPQGTHDPNVSLTSASRTSPGGILGNLLAPLKRGNRN